MKLSDGTWSNLFLSFIERSLVLFYHFYCHFKYLELKIIEDS